MHPMLLTTCLLWPPKVETHEIALIDILHVHSQTDGEDDTYPRAWVCFWGHDKALWTEGEEVVAHGFIQYTEGETGRPQPYGRRWIYEFRKQTCTGDPETLVRVIADEYTETWSAWDYEQWFRTNGGRVQDICR